MNDIETFLAEVEGLMRALSPREFVPWEYAEPLHSIPRLLQIVREQEDALRKAALRESNAKHELSKALGREEELKERLAEWDKARTNGDELAICCTCNYFRAVAHDDETDGSICQRCETGRLLERLAKLESEKQAVIGGMTRAITAEGKANVAYYAMQAERDAMRERVTLLEKALTDACDGWEYAAQYKGEFLAAKHGDSSDIAELRKLLKGSDNGSTETK